MFFMMMNKTLVFIDGAYLSVINKYYKNGKYPKIDINQFAHTISKNSNLWCSGIYYYCAPPFQSAKPIENEILKKSKYDKFVYKLRKKGINVREGRCQKIDGEYSQKGVDTLLTMDLFTEPVKQNIKTIIILTSDTDFVPILNNVRQAGIQVILFFYNDFKRNSRFSMSNYLYSACDKKVLLTDEHFEKSLYKKTD